MNINWHSLILLDFSFNRQAKIVKTDDFSSVFNLRKRIASQHLVLRYRLNEANMPRLGMIVSKKTAKLAVQRNYMRRVLRELFRLNQQHLPTVDLVVQVQKTFEKSDFLLIKQEYESLLQKLSAKVVSSK